MPLLMVRENVEVVCTVLPLNAVPDDPFINRDSGVEDDAGIAKAPSSSGNATTPSRMRSEVYSSARQRLVKSEQNKPVASEEGAAAGSGKGNKYNHSNQKHAPFPFKGVERVSCGAVDVDKLLCAIDAGMQV